MEEKEIWTIGSSSLEFWQGEDNPLVLQWTAAARSLEEAKAKAQAEVDSWQEEGSPSCPIEWKVSRAGEHEVFGFHKGAEEVVVLRKAEL